MEGNDKLKFDVRARQESAFNAARDNSLEVNKVSGLIQNWLLILSLAELSFLGTIFFSDKALNIETVIFLKIFIVLLLLGFISFFLGNFYQRLYLLVTAKRHFKIANRAVEYVNDGKEKLYKEPEDLRFPEQQIVSSSVANDLFKLNMLLVFVVTIGIIFIVIFWK